MTLEDRIARLEASMIAVLHFHDRNKIPTWEESFNYVIELWPELINLRKDKIDERERG